MSKQAVLTVGIDPKLKSEAEKVLKELGLTTAQAVTLFFKQVVLRRGLPFELQIPEEKTAEELAEAKAIESAEKFSELDDLFNNFDLR